jgi:murein DD-endopeptidase MepM/ murein hydrolase activator NlpD
VDVVGEPPDPGRSRGVVCALFVASLAATAAAGGSAPFLEPEGGGPARLPAEDPLTPARRAEIETRLDARRAASRRARSGLAPAAAPPSFAFPLRTANGFGDPGFHAVSNFVDLDPSFPDQLLDFACGERTYDRPNGYNHSGTDFFVWPFEWRRMFEGQVLVVAAAPGVILDKDDGNFDGNCVANTLPWNAVYVEHADGSVAWYGHLKEDSTTSRSVGASVSTGDYLGIVGSSGSSTGPHLHFEVQGHDGEPVDPFDGPCGATATLWTEQPAYYDSALNRVSTHDAPPQTDTCNAPEETHERDRFDPGEVVFYAAFYRDQLVAQTSTYTIRRPNGSVHSTWQHASPVPHYAASWWYWYQTLPGDAPFGTWRFEVSFLEQDEAHEFQVPEPAAWAQGWVALAAAGWVAGAGRRRRAVQRLAVAPGDQAISRPRIS